MSLILWSYLFVSSFITFSFSCSVSLIVVLCLFKCQMKQFISFLFLLFFLFRRLCFPFPLTPSLFFLFSSLSLLLSLFTCLSHHLRLSSLLSFTFSFTSVYIFPLDDYDYYYFQLTSCLLHLLRAPFSFSLWWSVIFEQVSDKQNEHTWSSWWWWRRVKENTEGEKTEGRKKENDSCSCSQLFLIWRRPNWRCFLSSTLFQWWSWWWLWWWWSSRCSI